MLVFIGTLHSHLTPHAELISLIERSKPSQVLIEITQEDIENNSLEKYPDEMRAVLKWATDHHIEVRGIDSEIKTLKPGVTDADLKSLDVEQMAIISEHNWKEFNQPAFYKVLETKTWQKIVDPAKDEARNAAIYANIMKYASHPDPTRTVVITGSGHIPYLMTQFPDAQFPLSR